LAEGHHPNSINDDAASGGAGHEVAVGAASKTRPTPATGAYAPPYAYEEDEIDLLDLVLVLAKHKRLILLLTLGLAFVTGVISLIMTPIYRAETRLVPPLSKAGISASIVNIPDFARGAMGMAPTPSDMMVGIIKSRTVVDTLIDKFDLLSYYEVEKRQEARDTLSNALSAQVDSKTGLITVSVEDKDPKLAATIANAAVEELQRLMQDLAITVTAQQRLFLEGQRKEIQLSLIQAEEDLKRYQEETGILSAPAQASSLMSAIANLQAEIRSREIRLTALRSFATTQNPEIQRLQAELEGLRSQLKKLETQAEKSKENVSAISLKELPQASIEYLRKLRDVSFYETLNRMILNQYEQAKMAEAQEAMVVQVVDPAVPPELKYKPKRRLMVAIAGVLGLFLSIFLAFFLEFLHNASNDPERAAKMAQLKSYLRFRKSSAKPT
jgi:tyrosine-protein kinase Etk/Wzc